MSIATEPAYPFIAHNNGKGHAKVCGRAVPPETAVVFSGLTKRELFAAMAMQGLYANPEWSEKLHEACAESAVSAADALIAALEAK